MECSEDRVGIDGFHASQQPCKNRMRVTKAAGSNTFQNAWRSRWRRCGICLPYCGLSGSAALPLLSGRFFCASWSQCMPVAILAVSGWIVNAIVVVRRSHGTLQHNFWWLVAVECLLAVLSSILSRGITYVDGLLGDRYTYHVSVRVMEHASRLDLTTFEDPIYYDRLERARVQATDRLMMIQMIGTVFQQAVTTIGWAATIVAYSHSPWLLALLFFGTLPAFLGESHFAFLGYAKNFAQTPLRRQMDYLRQVAGSKEAAKELKLFGLREFFVGRFREFAHTIFRQNVELERRHLIVGAFFL